MIQQNNHIENLGEKAGYIFGYFLLTTVLFLMLYLTRKLPKTWPYFNVMILTLTITLVAFGIRRLLK